MGMRLVQGMEWVWDRFKEWNGYETRSRNGMGMKLAKRVEWAWAQISCYNDDFTYFQNTETAAPPVSLEGTLPALLVRPHWWHCLVDLSSLLQLEVRESEEGKWRGERVRRGRGRGGKREYKNWNLPDHYSTSFLFFILFCFSHPIFSLSHPPPPNLLPSIFSSSLCPLEVRKNWPGSSGWQTGWTTADETWTCSASEMLSSTCPFPGSQ